MQADISTNILAHFEQIQQQWYMAIFPFARNLFGLLALVELAWAMAVLLLETRSDMQAWVAGLIRKVMWLGAFLALLQFGPQWIPDIIDSFLRLGQKASGIGELSPGGVFDRGVDLSAGILKAAVTVTLWGEPAVLLALMFAAACIFCAFLVIALQLMCTLVESYILTSAGLIFLGFGGSRWTASWVERYISMGIAIGIKLMLLYLFVGVGQTMSGDWLNAVKDINKSPAELQLKFCLQLSGVALMYMAICWRVPQFFSNMMAGTASFGVSDMVSGPLSVGMGAAGAVTIIGSAAKQISDAAVSLTKAVSSSASSTAPASTSTGFSSLSYGLSGGSAPNVSSHAAAAPSAFKNSAAPPQNGTGSGFKFSAPPPSSRGSRGSYPARMAINDMARALPDSGHPAAPPRLNDVG